MSNFFLKIYDYFISRRILLFTIMAGCFIVMFYFSWQVKFDEDVTSFFPDGKDNKKTALVFKNLKVKDKIILIFSQNDTVNKERDPDMLIEAGEETVANLQKEVGATHIKSITSKIDEGSIGQVTDFIYNNLPIFLTESDYAKLDTILTPAGIDHKMKENYNKLVSPMGVALKEFIIKDPIGLGNGALSGLQVFGEATNYRIYNSYIFSEDLSSMLVIIDPINGAGSTGKNDALITSIENQAKEIEAKNSNILLEHFGGPSVGVYNARQIKKDTMVTLTIALLIIVIFISLAFRNRWAMILISIPVIFGALFALSFISLFNGSISAIAMGSGAAVFGIAMSYSIHVLSHKTHSHSIRQVIDELASPLTVGSFTTIGAFLGLLFTSSKLLRDFGLFAALTLVGTTLFCLIFLPHLLKIHKHNKPNGLLTWVENLTAFRYDKSKILLSILAVIFVVSLFFYNDVTFDSDMMHLNFEPAHLKKAEQKLNTIFKSAEKTVIFVSTNSKIDSLTSVYATTNQKLLQLKKENKIDKVISAQQYLVPKHIQKERIARWNAFWTQERQTTVLALIELSGAKQGFAKNSFLPFAETLHKNYQPVNYTAEQLSTSTIFKDWYSSTDTLQMLITKVIVKNENKEAVYKEFKELKDVIIVDRGYFAQKMAISINNDFYLIFYISSLLIFIALLTSYGRMELALMTFVPMAVSWVIILGLMALFNIQFNIVNIILSTFIFGIGDDFSIFIMDGLQSEFSIGKKMLASHKTAIFFSAFTTIVGMGALIFAQHPALKSISVISILGMVTVVIISFTVQPILFKYIITLHTKKGNFPYSISAFLNTVYAFTLFLSGCATLQALSVILWFIPCNKKKKKEWFHYGVYLFNRFFLKMMITVRTVNNNQQKETFATPAIVVANHQSFIDILMLLSLSPKFVMVTNSWVYNSPFFGRIVRYADFYNADNGYELLVDSLKQKVADGYSIIVFPEGTRSNDNTLKRFHKGAFFLAQELQLDIVPIVLYGNGMISSKKQPFYIKKGIIASDIRPRILYNDEAFGTNYQTRTKKVSALFHAEYDRVCSEFNTPKNPYFYDALIKSYIYKGPILEWYMRIKVKMEKNYAPFDAIIPKKASITDIGCGYGPLTFMLSLLSNERTLLGIDYDEDKIDVANHSFLKNDKLTFVCANAVEYEFPKSDVFVLNDMLHYLDLTSQNKILEKCVEALNPKGIIIIRDGDKSKKREHKKTQFTEQLSTKIFNFNKTEGDLCFTSRHVFEDFAQINGLEITQSKNDAYTSNTIYILKKHE